MCVHAQQKIDIQLQVRKRFMLRDEIPGQLVRDTSISAIEAVVRFASYIQRLIANRCNVAMYWV